MSWRFLERALEEFGFHPYWAGSWHVSAILSFAILINGTPSDYFSMMGLQQDCLLSAYPFIIYADALLQALHAMSQSSDLDSYLSALGAQLILHLLFADDCLLLGRAWVPNIVSLGRVLEEYYLSSGQKVDLYKLAVNFNPKTLV